MSIALAIFAKTPGLSPVKTRLAEDIGKKSAEEFYKLSVKAVEEMAHTITKSSKQSITPYWALAEKEALTLNRWQNFNTMWTGGGDLGQRLHNIYSGVLQKHDFVALIGTDSPQLESTNIVHILDNLDDKPNSCTIGPAVDGGFYLFASNADIPEHIWKSTTYSVKTTMKELERNLWVENIHSIKVTERDDVDNAIDLFRLTKELNESKKLSTSQLNLLNWCKSSNFSHSPNCGNNVASKKILLKSISNHSL